MLVAVHAQFAFLEDADQLGVFLLHPVEHFLPEGLEFLEGERRKMLGMGFERCEVGRGDCGGLDADAGHTPHTSHTTWSCSSSAVRLHAIVCFRRNASV